MDSDFPGDPTRFLIKNPVGDAQQEIKSQPHSVVTAIELDYSFAITFALITVAFPAQATKIHRLPGFLFTLQL